MKTFKRERKYEKLQKREAELKWEANAIYSRSGLYNDRIEEVNKMRKEVIQVGQFQRV